MNIRSIFYLTSFISFLSASGLAQAEPITSATARPDTTIVEKQEKEKAQAEENPFAITFYKRNYLLPYYYTGSPYNSIYVNSTPGNEKLDRGEVKYQLSLKTPIWKNILGSANNLYFAYTQLSYWQAYNNKAFFRETDYQPEIFVNHPLNILLFGDYKINMLQFGFKHQSNGFGNALERSWNRIYLSANSSTKHFMFGVEVWYVIKDATYQKFNPNLANYLGYGELTFAYQFHQQVISLQTHSLLESGGRYATGTLSYSFPLNQYIRGFIEVFSGYGQSLIEYNHRTNSAGIGIALNDFIQ